jgi:nitric oxide reductase NorQ protein
MSTKQRFVAINFDYPSTDVEAGIIMHEAGIEKDIAHALTEIGQHVRNMKSKGLQEGASTRLLIDAGKLIKDGIEPLAACRAAILNPIIDDVDVYKQVYAGLEDVVKNFF